MNALLGALICFVLNSSQAFAISGGPWGRPGQVSVTGTYAAVMFPLGHNPACVDLNGNPVFCQGQPTGLNTIGLFSLKVTTNGIATGPAVVFTFGQTYTGTIQGLADPDSGKLNGLINATFPYVHTVQTSTDSNGNPVFTTETVLAVASGQAQGKIVGNTNTGTSVSARVRGKADIQFSLTVNNPFDDVVYKLSGFKQSESSG